MIFELKISIQDKYNKSSIQWTPVSQIYLNSKKMNFGQTRQVYNGPLSS